MNTAQLKCLRNLHTSNHGYSHTLHFTREFTSGCLVGMTHEDEIGFCSSVDCDEWVSAVNRNNKAGKVDYKVVSWRIEAAK
jgi:hypothetical protein